MNLGHHLIRRRQIRSQTLRDGRREGIVIVQQNLQRPFDQRILSRRLQVRFLALQLFHRRRDVHPDRVDDRLHDLARIRGAERRCAQVCVCVALAVRHFNLREPREDGRLSEGGPVVVGEPGADVVDSLVDVLDVGD